MTEPEMMDDYWAELEDDPIGRDMDPAGRLAVLVGGPENLVNAILRRLRCPKGYLPHRPLYGSMLHRFIGEAFDIPTALAVRGEAGRTILADDRVQAVTSLTVSETDSRDGFIVSATVECLYGPMEISGLIQNVGSL